MPWRIAVNHCDIMMGKKALLPSVPACQYTFALSVAKFWLRLCMEMYH